MSPPDRPKVKRNVAQCTRCGDVIESKHTHDFVRCACGQSFTDGGLEYIRRGGRPIDLSEYE